MSKQLVSIHCLSPAKYCFSLMFEVRNHYLQVGRDRLIEGSRGILQVRYYHFFSGLICEFLYTLALGAINHVSS